MANFQSDYGRALPNSNAAVAELGADLLYG